MANKTHLLQRTIPKTAMRANFNVVRRKLYAVHMHRSRYVRKLISELTMAIGLHKLTLGIQDYNWGKVK